MSDPRKPVNVFLSYAKEDEGLLRELEKHLSILKREGLISTWYDRQLLPGTNWAKAMDERLEQASIILLLVSPDFFSSDYCYQKEMKRALERHETGQARVVPILVRPVSWNVAPFAHLQALPMNARAITTWSNQDEAWADVVEGLCTLLEELKTDEGKKEASPWQAQPPVRAKRKVDPFPAIWNVSYRYTPFFTGRDQVLEQLFANFATSTVSLQALTGLGGLGKTQTAVAYAYRYRKHYQRVLWIKAETEGDLVASFTNVAKLLELPLANGKEHEHLHEEVEKWLSSTSDWLLILDNADNLAIVEPFLPMKMHNGHLLLTTRATAMDGLAQPLALTPLAPEDGALCLLRRANYIGWNADLTDPSLPAVARQAALDLAELMGGLPLALEQAGAYIETTGRGVTGYLKLYEQYREMIQKNQYGTVLYYRSAVAFAWNMAREAVKLENPAAIELLHLCAYLAPDAIPYALFPDDPGILGPILGPVAARPLLLDQALSLLRRHSLIKNEVDRQTDVPRIFIHRVLQEILRDGMEPDTQRLWAERAVRVVARALPVVEWEVLQAHVQMCLSLIEQWKMTFLEADLVRQHAETAHI